MLSLNLRKIIRKFVELICRFMSLINPIIYKSNKRILIFNSKPDFMNNYALFLYMIENNYNDNYKIYYIMPTAKGKLPSKKNVVYSESFLLALVVYMTSKVCFFDTGNIRIKPSKKQCVINLWHGIPLKSIGFMSNSAEKSLPKDLMNAFTYILAPIKGFDEVYRKSFNLKEEQIVHLGQPRNDFLRNDKSKLDLMGIETSKFKKIVMWMTTYRVSYDGRLVHTSNDNWSSTELPLITNDKLISELNDYLVSKDTMVIIKTHLTSKKSKSNVKSMSNVIFVSENDYLTKGIQLYEVLGSCDALITDYSSVYFDYLLLDKPIGFIVDDIEDYKKNNGFNVENPLEWMPGQHMNNFAELKGFLENVYDEKDDYKKDRKKLKSSIINSENNCEDVLRLADITIDKINCNARKG